MKDFFCSLLILLLSIPAFAQEPEPPVIDHSYKPLMLMLDDSGNKYIRFLIWNQFLLTGQENSSGDFRINAMNRRFRFLTYAQISPKFMILSHWGVNSLTADNMDPLGNRSDGPQLFLHAAWVEYAILGEALSFGGGLHYWNGPSRQSSASTLNFMTLDNYRQGWSKLGLSDQFARSLGVFVKGQAGRVTYNLSIDDPITNSLDVDRIPVIPNGETLYTGKFMNPDDASRQIQGYAKYDFLEVESCKLPYKVGSHLGKQRVLALGGGFVHHGSGSMTFNGDGSVTYHDVSQWAVDVYYDSPLGLGALTSYWVYYNFDYGPNYNLGQTYGTGSSVFGNAGYLLPPFTDKFMLQPFVAWSYRDFEAFDNTGNTFIAGTNLLMSFHQAKFTLEYLSTQPLYTGAKPDRENQIRLQMMIYL